MSSTQVQPERAAGDAAARALFDANPLACWVFDRETLRFLDVNQAAQRSYGYSRAGFLELKITDICRESEAEVRAQLAAGSGDRIVCPHHRRDGSVLEAEVSWRPIEFAGRPAALMVVYDISERLRLQRERDANLARVHEKQAILEGIFASTTDAVMVKDLEGRYVLINRAGTAVMGLTPDQVQGRAASDFFSSEETRAIEEHEAEVIASGRPQSRELPVHIAGEERYYLVAKAPFRDQDGNIIGTVTTSRDVTARKRAERVLAAKEEALRLAYGAAEMWPWEIRDGVVRRGLSAFAPGYGPGYTESEEPYDYWLRARVHPEDRERVAAQVDASFHHDAPYEVEFRLLYASGEYHWIHARGRLVRDAGGRPVALMGVSMDVTERRRAQDLRRAEELHRLLLERVLDAQEEERRRIARELHDEAGQLLTYLLVGLRTVEEARTVKQAKEQAARLREVAALVIDEVGRLARGLHPAVLDDLGLVPALERYAAEYTRAHGLAVRLETAALSGVVLSRPVQLGIYRIVQEALTNTAKHAGARQVVVAFRHRDGELELSVSDDGRGLAAGERKPSRTRLGLQSMRERAALLGGSLRIRQRRGGGTRLVAAIPVPPATRAAHAAAGH